MSAPALPSTSSRLGLTSSLRVHRVVVSLVAAVLFLTDFVLCQDPPEPVTPKPEYIPARTEVIAREGDRAVLPCGIRDLGTKQVAWKRLDEDHFMAIAGEKWVKDDAISMDARQEDLTDLTFWDLIFDPVRQEHAGVYECQIAAKVKQSRNVTLKVEGPPIKKALPDPGLVLTGERYVELGQKILLTCTVHTGHHVHQDIDWFKDGNKLVSDSKRGIVITKYNSAVTRSLVSELIIDHSRSTDSGTYICRSAWDKIDIQSLKVTVLNADTTNVKREDVPGTSDTYRDPPYGRGSSTCPHSQQGFSSSIISVSLSLTLAHLRWMLCL